MKKDYQKALNKLTFFLSNPALFNGQNYEKQKGSGNSYQALFRLQNKFRKIFLLVMYLPDQVWWCNIKRFFSYSKNHICSFTQANSWNYKIFYLHLSFGIWKVRKGRQKIPKISITQERKELFRWNKKHFS